jgi:hypothetical protein
MHLMAGTGSAPERNGDCAAHALLVAAWLSEGWQRLTNRTRSSALTQRMGPAEVDMLRVMTVVAVVEVLLAVTANVAEARNSPSLHGAGMAATVRSHYEWGSYRNVRGFNHRPGFYIFASPPPTISSFPMPFTVWY